MANPEHVKLIKGGKEAVARWKHMVREKHHDGDYESFLHNIALDLSGADLSNEILEDLPLVNANIKNAKFQNTEFFHCDFIDANLEGADLRRTFFAHCTLWWANMSESDLSEAFFIDTMLWQTKLRKANLSNAFFCNSCLTGANLEGATLDGILIFGSGIDEWNISNVRCTHFFLPSEELRETPEPVILHADGLVRGKRIPPQGYLAPGEFEDRFKSRPTIEFIFEHGVPALGPALLGLAVDQANLEHPESALRILSIDARGGIPRAVIEIAEKVSKKDALALVEACYQQKIRQMRKEIKGLTKDKESLLEIASRKVLLPALGGTDSFMGAADLAKHYGVDTEALRKRLDRHREKHTLDTNLFIESQDRGKNKPKYLYNAEMVLHIIEELKSKEASIKRPSGKN